MPNQKYYCFYRNLKTKPQGATVQQQKAPSHLVITSLLIISWKPITIWILLQCFKKCQNNPTRVTAQTTDHTDFNPFVYSRQEKKLVEKKKGDTALTSIRKSPVLRPACHATPPSSTDSKYCRAGKAGVGVNSSMGVSAEIHNKSFEYRSFSLS